MILDSIDYHKVKTAFLTELRLAHEGKNSSVSFIRHTLPDKPLITSGVFQGIVIGGTNYVDSSRRILKNGKRRTLTLKYGTLPVFTNRQTLVSFLTRHLNPKADAIGVNFGFALKPHNGPFGEIDGTLIRSTKEHTFINVKEPIGTIVREIFETHYNKRVPVSVANDSVCLALSGEGNENASLIVGTGVNMSVKVSEKNKTSIVNLEAGNFNKFPKDTVLKIIDSNSAQRGQQLLEKIVSGKYLEYYFNEKATALGLSTPPLTNGKELTELAAKRSSKQETLLAREILERSAFLVASIVAALFEFSGSPKKYTLITEGSVFWKGWQYQDNVHKQLAQLGVPKNVISFKHIKDSSIRGAIGLLTN